MATSQNGWLASRSKSAIGIITPRIGTVDFPQGVKGGDVATVLMYVAAEFDSKVEKLRDGWCWGYHYKPIEGTSTLSNHASGTAIDLNAPNHPMGKRNTFSTKQRAAIRTILNYCEGVVRWGGDYSGRPDDMHFEIHGNAAAVAQVAKKITNRESTVDLDTERITFVQNDDVSYSTKSTTLRAWYSSAHYYILQTRNRLLGQFGNLFKRIDAIEAKIDAIATAPPGSISDEQLERVLRRIIRSVPGDQQ